MIRQECVVDGLIVFLELVGLAVQQDARATADIRTAVRAANAAPDASPDDLLEAVFATA